MSLSINRILAALMLSLLAVACSAADADDPTDGDDGDDELGMFPAKGYGGYDGVHSFAIPVATALTGVTWMIDPAQGAVSAKDAPAEYVGTPLQTWALVEVRASGALTVSASAGDQQVTAELEITSYLPTEIEAGRQRYFEPVDGNADDRVACVSCHGQADGHDQSPLSVMIWSDAEVLRAITTGFYTDSEHLTVAHSWNIADAEARGIVGYLRSLPPRGF